MMLTSLLLATLLGDPDPAPASGDAEGVPAEPQPQAAPSASTEVVAEVAAPVAAASSELNGHRFATRLAMGGSYYTIGDIPAYGADAIVALGGMGAIAGWSIEGGLFEGRTLNGLAVHRVSLGPNFDVRLGRAGLGFGFTHAVTSIERTTRTGSIGVGSTSAVLRLTVDLLRWDPHHALFVGGRVTYGSSAGSTGGDIELLNAGLLLGYRFRL